MITYCETCIRFTADNGVCRKSDCSPSLPTELDGHRVLHANGYRLNLGYLWRIRNDDEENFQEDRIGPWVESSVEAVRALIRTGWPQTEDIPCASCRDAEVEFLGDLCHACSIDLAEQISVGEYL